MKQICYPKSRKLPIMSPGPVKRLMKQYHSAKHCKVVKNCKMYGKQSRTSSYKELIHINKLYIFKGQCFVEKQTTIDSVKTNHISKQEIIVF